MSSLSVSVTGAVSLYRIPTQFLINPDGDLFRIVPVGPSLARSVPGGVSSAVYPSHMAALRAIYDLFQVSP